MLFHLDPNAPSDALLGKRALLVADMNGDGLAEIAIDDDRPFGGPGHVYVVFGKPDMTDVRMQDIESGEGGFVIYGETGGTTFPWVMNNAGDVDGDGTPDLVFGNVNVDVNGDNAGSGYVVFGKGDGVPVEIDDVVAGVGGFVIRGALANDDLGGEHRAAAGGSDLDGDGLDDVLIAAPRGHVDGLSVGRAYVVYGKSSGTPVEITDLDGSGVGFSLTGRGGNAGGAVDLPGDVNGDGHPDLVVSASSESAIAEKSGRVYVVFGGPDLDTMDLADVETGAASGFIIESTGWFDSCGAQTTGLGDVNGDGLADLYVTSGDWGHVILGKADTDTVYLGEFGSNGTEPHPHGYRVYDDMHLGGGLTAAPMGDADGDGLADFVLGGFGRPMILVLGKTDHAPILAEQVRLGTAGGAIILAEGDAFGWSFAGGHDVDGDGWPDLVVGRPYWFEEPSWGFVYSF